MTHRSTSRGDARKGKRHPGFWRRRTERHCSEIHHRAASAIQREQDVALMEVAQVAAMRLVFVIAAEDRVQLDGMHLH